MKLPFEKIYCLHILEAKERYGSVIEECNKIELENEVNFWYTCKKPINLTIGNNIESLHDSYYNRKAETNEYTYGAVFDCAYNHYSIIKQAYMRGINSILIFEDDILFNKISVLKNIIDNIPNDYDVLKFYNTVYDKKNVIVNNVFFQLIDNPDKYCNSTLCYALSRKGMEAVINEYESNLVAADIALNNITSNKDIKFYVLKLTLFCKPKKFISTIVGK
jgi:GR25 family glycosyltransferase involved in LPS biosynthesis